MDIDPVKEAEQMAQIFANLSAAVDRFRLDPENFASIPDGKQRELKSQAQALAMRSQQCNADTLCAILQSIQPHLANIKKATGDARDTLTALKDVAKGFAIVDAAVNLARSIATADVGTIGDEVDKLSKAIQS